MFHTVSFIIRLDPSFERTELLIQEYAHEGLRTLCIAKKVRSFKIFFFFALQLLDNFLCDIEILRNAP